MHEGRAGWLFIEELQGTIAAAGAYPELLSLAKRLDAAQQKLQDVTLHLFGLAGEKGPEVFLADATLFLELFGTVAIAWQWLLQSVKAQAALASGPSAAETNFYQGKLYTGRYFFSYELPKIEGLAIRLLETNPLTMGMETAFFND